MPTRPVPRPETADLAVDLFSAVLLTGAATALITRRDAAGFGSVVGVSASLVAPILVSVLALLRARRRAAADPQRVFVLGSGIALRSGSVLVLLCAWAGMTSITDLGWAGLAALVLTAGIAVEDVVLRLLRLPAPFVHALPGVRPLPSPSKLVPALGWVSVAGLLAGVVVRLLGGPGWCWTLAAVASLVPIVRVVWHARARRRIGAVLAKQIPAALAQYAPEFVLYTARPDDASYQVTMWLPYLRRTGRRFVIITRAPLPAERLAELTDVPVLVRRTASELESALVPSVRAAFYVNASSGNGALTRFRRLRHVYLGHGDSDKPPSYNPTHAMFDTIFAAGPAAVRRYADHGVQIAVDKFRLVGRPQVESVEAARRPLAGAVDPVVLYAPTWRGHVAETALSSLDVGEQIVAGLLTRGATVIFRPHPFSYDFSDDAATVARIQSLLAADRARTGRAHRWGTAAETECSVIETMNAADALVSDVSSVVSDFLFSAKPYAMIATTDQLDDFARDYPIAQSAYLVDPALRRLPAALDLMLGDDPYAAKRLSVRADYLGAAEAAETGDYAQTFVVALTDLLDEPTGPEEPSADTDDGTARVSRDTIRRHTRVLARTLGGLTTSVLALTVALSGQAALSEQAASGGQTVAGVVGVIAALVGVVILLSALLPEVRTALRRRRGLSSPPVADRPTDRLTVLDTVRIALILSVVAGVGPARPSALATAALALTLLLVLAAVVSEAAVVRLLAADGVIAANLPQLRVREVSALQQLAAPVVGSLVLMIEGLLALALVRTGPPAVSDLLLVAIALPAAVAAGLLVRAAVHRARDAAEAELRLPAVLTERGTAFCAYFGSGIGASYQLGMWLPYFERIGSPFLIVCRDRSVFAEIRTLAAGRVPVLLRETLASLEAIVVPGLRAAFYVNNAVRNTHLIERRELTHVWLNHGDSEKPACFNPVHAIYDLIFVAGQAGIDRYARHGVQIPAAKFRIVGRPQVEDIQPCVQGSPPPERTVLYAPTWRGPYADSQLYSLPQGGLIVGALLRRGVRVIFRAHPFNYRFPDASAMIGVIGELLARDRRQTGRNHLWGAEAEIERGVVDCFNASEAMISDVSAMVSDYLQSTKPFGVVAIGRTPEELIFEMPAAAGGYLVAEDLDGLEDLLDHLLGEDPLRGARTELRDYYLGGFATGEGAEDYADGFLCAARDIIRSEITTGAG